MIQIMQAKLKNPTMIVAPVSQEELEKGFGWASINILYRNKYDYVEVGIPDLMEDYPELANMEGVEEATEKAIFYSGGSKLAELSTFIKDRPVYALQLSAKDKRLVLTYDIINDVDVKLPDVLNGSFEVVPETLENNQLHRR